MTAESSSASKEWTSYLTEQGARWKNDQLIGFAENPPGSGPLLVPLVHQRLLEVAGPDAEKFLQGQLTCDLRRATAGEVLLGAHCDHKGRMHSSFHLAAMEPEIFGLRLHESIAASAAGVLGKYIVFSKAEVSEAQGWHCLALFGEGAADAAAGLSVTLPDDAGRAVHSDGVVLLRHGADSLEIWARGENGARVWQALRPHTTPAAPDRWDLFQIEQGLAQVRSETAGELIPQMLNYQYLDGISFKKGCFTGQEVVARMHYLGQAKKRLYRASAVTEQAPEPGAPLYHAGTGKQLGLLVQAAISAPNLAAMLVVCSADAERGEPVALGSADGPRLQWQPLPHSVA